MADRSSEPLRRQIEKTFPDRPFTLRFWDGAAVEATREGPTLTFRSPRALGHVLRAPGELGIGRAYATGEIEVDDLDAAIALLGRWHAPRMSTAAKLGLGRAAIQAAGVRRFPPPPAAELKPSRKRHSRARDAEAVRHHYDVSNEFFSLFLDESMTYSCALWEDADSLEEAQRAKLELICAKLELEEGQRMLDIGAGWGSLGIHAAREHGVSVLGITLSPPQAELANERARDAGVGGLARFEVADYRDLADDSFDAVASIGMVEHVGGSQADEYGRQVARMLRPGGKVLNHGIAYVPPTKEGFHVGGAFSDRYVFPDGEVQNLSRMLLSFERAGLETLHVESLHRDYAETLRHWATRLDEHLDRAEQLAGPERLRVWRLYLRAARNGFETGQTSVYQMLCSHPVTEPARDAPIGLRHEAPRRRTPV
ncbi:MAG TPA: cyclopropane-fatty-acyl-phospholipid synthase family protein [Solirubrobacterales bacterium]|jgi:cyclopropane-fatty-acyl-phospholipid synthase|nr:cyclopropane-fatty-acyl-phospholipid synthase family protein [Solirubrobacterales bacterium]